MPTSETFGGAINGTLSRTYDNNFRTTQLAVNGSAIALGYDNDDLLTSAGAMSFTRHAQNGLLTGTALGNTTTTHNYNAFGELATFTANYDTNALLNDTYTYDTLGRITTKTEILAGATDTWAYNYDLAGRLQTVTKNGVTVESYGYDANGNRSGGTYDDQDRLLAWAGNTYNYTANGELQTKAVGPASAGQQTHYTYDVYGNLQSVTLPDGTPITYLTDGRNRRIGKQVSGTTAQAFLYQDQLRIAAELDGANNLVSRFVYGTKINVPEYMIKSGTTYRILTDHLGSVRLVVNTTDGGIAQRMDYDGYGNVISDTNPGFQPFGFAGGLYDNDTKLTRFGARDYDAEIGRWLSKDPIRFRGGDTNLFAYVGGNPISLTDPTGLDVCLESTNNANVPFGLHQRVAVYDSSGNFVYGQSFGTTNPNTGLSTSEGGGKLENFSGAVYPDVRDSTRDKKACTSSTDDQNKKIISALQSQLGARGPYSATGIRGMSCRTYSSAIYNQIANQLRGGK